MRFPLALFLIVVALLPVAHADAHIADEFPQVTLQVSIDDQAVQLIVRVPAGQDLMAMFAGLSPIEMDQMEPVDLAALIEPMFAERCPVKVDGLVVPPTILGAQVKMSNSRLPARSFPLDQVMKQGSLVFVAVYETKGPAKNVSLHWSIFANEYDEQGQRIHTDEDLQVVTLVNAYEREQLALLTPIEPAYTWHAQGAASLRPDLLDNVPIQRSEMMVPALSIAFVVLGFILAYGLWWSGRPGAWVTLGVCIVAGAVSLPFGQITIEHTAPQARPSDAQSLAIFESLHRNIYRAFDFTNESAVYDALAQSVDGPMLEAIYNDVYQSLIMQEQNGAVSKVVRVEIQESALLEIEDSDTRDTLGPAAYRVQCRWTVDGLVTHFGHSHARTNAFEAIYTVAPRAAGWRIVDAQIIEQQRIDDGNQTAKDVLNNDKPPRDTPAPLP